MDIIRVEDAPVARRVGGFEGRSLAEGPAASIMHVTLDPGAVLEPHSAPVDASFFVLEGEAELTFEGETAPIKAGALFASPRGTVRGMRNTGSGPFRVLVIKSLQ